MIHVLRAKPGLEVILFDGSGLEFLARVERIERATVRLAVLERRAVDRESPLRLTLGVALPKGDRQRRLIEKATELGVARLVPLVTARSVAQPTAESLRRLEAGRDRSREAVRPQSADGDRRRPNAAVTISRQPKVRRG